MHQTSKITVIIIFLIVGVKLSIFSLTFLEFKIIKKVIIKNNCSAINGKKLSLVTLFFKKTIPGVSKAFFCFSRRQSLEFQRPFLFLLVLFQN